MLTLILYAAFIQGMPLYCQPDVVSAMDKIWQESDNGRSGKETAFTVIGDRVEMAEYSNVENQADIKIHENTTALFHVHPHGTDPKPSVKDQKIAEKYGIEIYTVSDQGLFKYDPESHITLQFKLGTDWTKPCSCH
jgi:hypothetical protein